MRHITRALVVGLALQACAEEEANVNPVMDAGRDAGSVADAGTRALVVGMDSGLDRSSLTNVGRDPLDYANPAFWACRPDSPSNECHANLDATEILKDGTQKVIKHERAENPEFDCFYVYPTVDLSGGNNFTDFSEAGLKLVQDPLLAQGARFNRVCEVYAPLYRQLSIKSSPDGTTTLNGDPALAVGDVYAAFDYYMKNLNKGRPFVLVGHSQGTAMLVQLIANVIDGNEALRKQLISAVMLGGAVQVPPGEAVGGSFKNVPVCTEPKQTGCVVAYVSYREEAPPSPENARFGRAVTLPDGTKRDIACTAPAPLAGNDGRYRGSYFRTSASNNPGFVNEGELPEGITTPFALYRDMFRGECVNEGGFSYLSLSVDKTDDDTRAVPPYLNPRLEGSGWGLHLVDFNPALDDLIELVSQQAEALAASK